MIDTLRSWDGEELTYEYRKGTKKTLILFLHVLGGDYTYWKRSMDYFHKKGYSTLSYRLRGHGPKRYKFLRITLYDHLQDIDSLLKKLKLKGYQLYVVGSSLGGTIAAGYSNYKHIKAICIDTPYEHYLISRSVKSLMTFFMPIALFDYITRRKQIDFSTIKKTNSTDFFLKAITHNNGKGSYLNYAMLLAIHGLKLTFEEIFPIVSDEDRIVQAPNSKAVHVKGPHHCVLQNTDEVNKKIEDIILNKIKPE